MIPFFRKIRYRLAKNNQFFKYSRYAIGEIVLVVIGILIALQINNWNEGRKLKNQFDLGLSEVYKDLLINYYGQSSTRDRLEYQLIYMDSILNEIELSHPRQIPRILQIFDHPGYMKSDLNYEWIRSLFEYNPYDHAQNTLSQQFHIHLDKMNNLDENLSLYGLNLLMIEYLREYDIPISIFSQGSSFNYFINTSPVELYDEETIKRAKRILKETSFIADLKSLHQHKRNILKFNPIIKKDLKSFLNHIAEQYPKSVWKIHNIEIIGTATEYESWATGIKMKQDKVNSGKWSIEIELKTGSFKFRANENWEFDWGRSELNQSLLVFKGGNFDITKGRYLIEIDIDENTYLFNKMPN